MDGTDQTETDFDPMQCFMLFMDDTLNGGIFISWVLYIHNAHYL